MKELTRRTFIKGIGVAAGGLALNMSPAFLRYGLGETPVKWGSLHPLTGGLAEMAADQKAAVELAIEDMNARGGVMGRQVVGVFRDTEFDAAVATRKAIELLDKEKVDLFAGALSGPEELAFNDIARKRDIFYGCYTQYMVDKKELYHKYTFTANSTVSQCAMASSLWAAENVPGKRWHLLADNYSWPKMFEPIFMKIAKEKNAEWTGTTWAAFPSTDYSSYIPKIKVSNPDVLFCVCWASGHINLIKQLQEFGVTKDIKVIFAVSDLPWAVAAGAGNFTNMYAGTPWFWGIEAKYPEAKKFNARFMEKQKRYCSGYGAVAYEMTRIALDTANEIKSLDSAALRKGLLNGKFKYLKGEGWIRPCDNVYISEFFLVKGKSKESMSNPWDFYELAASVEGERSNMPCSEKGLA